MTETGGQDREVLDTTAQAHLVAQQQAPELRSAGKSVRRAGKAGNYASRWRMRQP